jgi:hypothetical protein
LTNHNFFGPWANKLHANLQNKLLEKLKNIHLEKFQPIPSFLSHGLMNFAPTFQNNNNNNNNNNREKVIAKCL